MIVAENGKIRIELVSVNGEALVRLSGIIDEDVNLGLVLSALSELRPPPGSLVLDLAEVKRINSCGIREWILFLKKIPEPLSLAYEKVSSVLMDQANPIPDVLGRGRGTVRSFEAPYYCGACAKVTSRTLEPSQVGMSGSTPVPPEQRCEACSTVLQFDGIAEEYFYFLKWAARGQR